MSEKPTYEELVQRLQMLEQAETRHKEIETELQASEQKYASLFNQFADGIYLHDTDGAIIDINRAAVFQSGYSKDELLQMSVFDLHPDTRDREDILRQWHAWPPGGPVTLEASHRRKDGTIYPVEVTTGVFLSGEKRLMMAIVQDITRRKQIEAQLLQAQKMEAIGRLAGGIAHDFNNMLGVILGHVDLAMGKLAAGKSSRDHLMEIREAAERSASLTRQLLAFARLQNVHPRVIDLNEVISGMLTMLEKLIGENIRLAWSPSVDIWPVKIDPSQIDQIMANLCINARDSITGVGHITIETANIVVDAFFQEDCPGLKPGQYVMFSVGDDGCGMDPATLARIFEPFFTTKEVGRGTGLGLSTVYGVLKQNNGFIYAQSTPGDGTKLTAYLPRYIGETDRRSAKDAGGKNLRGRETILLVEDDPATLKMTTMMLEELGYTVLPADTPTQAIRLAREHAGEIRLAITDVVMPEMNGHKLGNQLQDICPGLKCLFMSGYTTNVIANHGVLAPGVHFIQKPFTLKSISEMVRKVLNGG